MENAIRDPYKKVASVLAQLNTEVVGQILRGENTAEADLDKIVEIAEESGQRALAITGVSSTNNKAMMEDKGAEMVGLPTITNILAEYEVLRDIRDQLVRSLVIRTADVLRLQKGTVTNDDHEGVEKVDAVLTPPGANKAPIQPGEGVFTKEFEERLAMLQLILLDLGIDPREENNVTITIGNVHHNMVRDLSYASVFIPKLKRLVEICNEVGNRSFVWNTETSEDVLSFGAMTKAEKDVFLEANPLAGNALVMRQGWENEMRLLLKYELAETVTTQNGIERDLRKTRKERHKVDQWIEKLETWQKEHPDVGPPKKGSLGKWLARAREKLRDGGFTDEQAQKLTTMGVKAAEVKAEITKTPDEWIEELQTWRTEHPDTWPSNKGSLGTWVKTARRKLRDGDFTEAQASRLTKMGVKPAEVKTVIPKTYDKWIEELQTWRKENPDTWPSSEESLRNWLLYARRKLRDGGFTEEQTRKLAAIGVKAAEVKAEITKTHDEWIEELQTWRKEHPDMWPYRKEALGAWLAHARQNLRDGGFTEEQAGRLRKMGVKAAEVKTVIPKTSDKWIDELQVWRKEHPDTWPPHKEPLGVWLANARRKLRNGGFTEEQVGRLTDMGVTVAKIQTTIKKTFAEWMTEVETWRKDHPNAWPSQKESLGVWLANARRKLRDGDFSEEEVGRLKIMGVIAAKEQATITKTSDEWIAALQVWKATHPDVWPSQKEPLGKWLGKARMKLRKGGFTNEQTAKLKEMGLKEACRK